jgi:hypothetical protein
MKTRLMDGSMWVEIGFGSKEAVALIFGPAPTCSGSITLQMTPAQAREIARQLIDQADSYEDVPF